MTIHTIRSGIVAWWSKGRHRLLALAAVATAFGILFGLAMGHWRSSPGPYMRKLEMHGTWLRAPGRPGYVGYFRHRFNLPGPVKHAWIAVAAREGFEVCINQNPAGRFYLWRPTRPFQTGLSDGGQVINPSPPALALNFPREYQWSSHRNDWLPPFFDVTQQFVPGRNVITVEVESRRAPRRFGLMARSRSGRARKSGSKAVPTGSPNPHHRSTLAMTGPSRSILRTTGVPPSP